MSHLDGAIPYADARRALWFVVNKEAELVRRRRRRRGDGSLWARVRDAVGFGSTTSIALCRDMGFDPETGEVERERGWELPAPPDFACALCGGGPRYGESNVCGACALRDPGARAAAGGGP